MTVADLSHLPKADDKPEGLAPDATVRFGDVVARANARQPDKPTAFGTDFRYSSAAKCARALSYAATPDMEPSPYDLTTYQTFAIGTALHDLWQWEMAQLFPDGAVAFEVPSGCAWDGEKAVSAPRGEALTSGSCDALLDQDSAAGGLFSTVVELKTVGGWGYKGAVGYRGAAEGPKTPHIVQLALNVVGCDADEGVLVYMAKDMIAKGSRGFDDDDPTRFVAEWTFTRDELQPIADRELKRLAEIARIVADGGLAPRHVPYEMEPGARIVDVDSSAWTLEDDKGVLDTGTLWNGKFCSYCDWQDTCREDER